MAETKIEWCDFTFNHVIGCTKVAPGCANCYAESYANRYGKAKWGPQGTRVKTSEAYWRQPLKWNREAEKAGERRRVFCASLADVWEEWDGPIVNSDGERMWHLYPPSGVYVTDTRGHADKKPLTMADLRRDLFAMIDQTPWLDWLLLTKRPENIRRMMAATDLQYGTLPQNIWLGCSVSDQKTADEAIPHLLACRDLSPVLFLSAEPLLGPVNIIDSMPSEDRVAIGRGHPAELDWVIVGGESGHNARPCHIDWIRDIMGQCREAGVATFVKQCGSNVHTGPDDHGWGTEMIPFYVDPNGKCDERFPLGYRVKLRDSKGGDMAEWPADLRVRESPAEVRA